MSKKILDTVYMMVCPNNTGIVYDVSSSRPGQVWTRVIEESILGTGHTKKTLWKQGYRVKKVEVWLE